MYLLSQISSFLLIFLPSEVFRDNAECKFCQKAKTKHEGFDFCLCAYLLLIPALENVAKKTAISVSYLEFISFGKVRPPKSAHAWFRNG